MVDTETCSDLVPASSSGLKIGTRAYSYRYCNSLSYPSDFDGTERVRCCYIDVKKENIHYRGCLPVKARELDNIDDFIDSIENGNSQGDVKININFYAESYITSFQGSTVKVLDCSSSYIYPFLLISLLLLF